VVPPRSRVGCFVDDEINTVDCVLRLPSPLSNNVPS